MNISVDCIPYIPVDVYRFIIIGILSGCIAIFGVISNLLLFRFFKKTEIRLLPGFYLMILAVLDTFICFCYIMIMSGDAVTIYLRSSILSRIWHFYVLPLYTGTRVAELCCSYVILLASFERYCLVSQCWKRWPSCICFQSDLTRKVLVLLIFCCSLGLRLSSLFETKVEIAKNCTESLGFMGLSMSPLVQSPAYHLFDWYFVPFVKVFLPVACLFCVNVGIIRALRRQNKTEEVRREITRREIGSRAASLRNDLLPKPSLQESADMTLSTEVVPLMSFGDICRFRSIEREQQRRETRRIRHATVMVVALVSSYLICNSLNVFLRILERFEKHELLIDSLGRETIFYTLSSDLISFLVMFNSFMRIAVYSCFNPDFRLRFRGFYTCWTRPQLPRFYYEPADIRASLLNDNFV